MLYGLIVATRKHDPLSHAGEGVEAHLERRRNSEHFRRAKTSPSLPVYVPPPVPPTPEAMQQAIDAMSRSGKRFAEMTIPSPNPNNHRQPASRQDRVLNVLVWLLPVMALACLLLDTLRYVLYHENPLESLAVWLPDALMLLVSPAGWLVWKLTAEAARPPSSIPGNRA